MKKTEKTEKTAWTTEQIKRALRLKYDAQAYALLWEVRNGTGFVKHERRADALVMSLWPSRGLELHGFEIKQSRSDWKKELDTPEKAESIARVCDRWWLVVGDREIVKPGELPPTWGLMAPKGQSLAVVTEPTKLEPVPFNRSFVAAVLRACQDQLGNEAREKKAKDEGWQAGFKAGQEHDRSEHDRLKKSVETFEEAAGFKISLGWPGPRETGDVVKACLERNLLMLEKNVRTFEEKSGLVISQYQGSDNERLGEAVRLVRDGTGAAFQDKLDRMVRELQPFLAALEELRGGIRAEPKARGM